MYIYIYIYIKPFHFFFLCLRICWLSFIKYVFFFKLSHFSSVLVPHKTLHLAFCFVSLNSAAPSIWILTKFSYLSFGICLSDIL